MIHIKRFIVGFGVLVAILTIGGAVFCATLYVQNPKTDLVVDYLYYYPIALISLGIFFCIASLSYYFGRLFLDK